MNKPLEQIDVIFLDRDMVVKEGFTNGMLLQFREKLRRFNKMGLSVGIVSLVGNQSTANGVDPSARGIAYSETDGLPTYNYVFDYNVHEGQFEHTENILSQLLNVVRPKIVLTYTAAVFLTELDVLTLKQANSTNAIVVNILADQLFPNPKEDEHPKDLMRRYYDEVRKTKIVSVSQTIKEKFAEATGITVDIYKNLWDLSEIILPKNTPRGKYITLVNVHPIKGIRVFERIAEKLPNQQFLVIKSWPDVEPYQPPTANITFRDFFKDPRELYRQTKMLLVPSLHNEGGARVTMEAMINGIPVIAHSIGSLPEMVTDSRYRVQPPKIEKHLMKGTIMIPIVSEEEVERAANDFVRIITQIESSPDLIEEHSNNAKNIAISYVTEAERIFERQAHEWLSEHPRFEHKLTQ